MRLLVFSLFFCCASDVFSAVNKYQNEDIEGAVEMFKKSPHTALEKRMTIIDMFSGIIQSQASNKTWDVQKTNGDTVDVMGLIERISGFVNKYKGRIDNVLNAITEDWGDQDRKLLKQGENGQDIFEVIEDRVIGHILKSKGFGE